ncbi:hypothetical protein DP116_13275 [Brasilonema bromeliae SPC951]|uniref:Methyltransferase domain-containing protein n=1 Tax=Brasilonema bromeliae SPC951 TaxID=385972 RepID=A0ABX1P7K7_9CYAN|nr:hypothetical protein [Brasilonema bromeliae SPC951]
MPTSSAEFGDYQTPDGLVTEVYRLLVTAGVGPKMVIEPTCGSGNLLAAAAGAFPNAACVSVADINSAYVDAAVAPLAADRRVSVRRADFFTEDWSRVIAAGPDPVLVVGTPLGDICRRWKVVRHQRAAEVKLRPQGGACGQDWRQQLRHRRVDAAVAPTALSTVRVAGRSVQAIRCPQAARPVLGRRRSVRGGRPVSD